MAHAPATTETAHAAEHASSGEHHNSFWPITLTIGTTLFLLGSLYWPLAIVGVLILGASVVGWVREDVHELRGKPFYAGSSPYLWGTIVLILSEVVLFGILFTFYFWSKSHQGAGFVPHEILDMDMLPIWINTALLISSGVTAEVAKHSMKKGSTRGFQAWMGVTILLGIGFVAGQINEYLHLMGEGLTATSSVYGTAFYSLTGVHGLHVVAGVIVLSTLFGLSFTGFIRKERLSGMEGAFLYWHFVDAIWILVVTFVYVRVI